MARPNARNIRGIRTRQGIRRKDLARDAEISYSFLAGIENGHVTAATETLVIIARVLGVTLDDVMLPDDDTDDRTPE